MAAEAGVNTVEKTAYELQRDRHVAMVREAARPAEEAAKALWVLWVSAVWFRFRVRKLPHPFCETRNLEAWYKPHDYSPELHSVAIE
jgi:hypothetical protein